MNARRGVVLLALAAAVGCGPSATPTPPAATTSGSAEWQGSIEERNGVVHVRNPEAGLWENGDEAPLRLIADGAFGGPASGIGSIAGAIVDREGNLHVLDAAAGVLIKLDAEGGVLHRAGDATAEAAFRDVRGMAYDGDAAIWVVNRGGTRLDAWGIDGSPRAGFATEDLDLGSVYMGGFLSGGRLALLTDEAHHVATNEYVLVDTRGEPRVLERFSIAADPMTPIPPSVVLQLSHYFDRERILVGAWQRYVLRAFDDQGNLRRRVTRPVDYLRRPGFALVGEQYLGVALGGLAAPIVLDNGYWLVLASWPTNVDDANAFAETPAAQRPPIEWASSLDLFDDEGRFLYSLRYPGSQTPEIGRPWTVGPDGRLFTVVAEPFPQVRRYRLVLQPPS